MMPAARLRTPLKELRSLFGSHLQENVRMANYTTARVGGPADALIIVQSLEELESAVSKLWSLNVPFYILGSGSNLLVSDAGIRGVVLINRARNIKVDAHTSVRSVWTESGANFGTIARQVALRGLSGLEWAVSIPGTIGGAVYGNAGAHGSDMQANLIVAEILHPDHGRETWPVEKLAYGYRTSSLKLSAGRVENRKQAVILAARLRLTQSTIEAVQEKMTVLREKRRSTQPPGASMGSTFRNPAGDYAGRLIEAVGLKGLRVGGAEISPIHANFIVTQLGASAADVWALIEKMHTSVFNKFGIRLQLEIECLGDWPSDGPQPEAYL